ncbi:MAG: tetratricopeptide repeat protein [Verrucomicrobiales bacterium]|nr:tetratricopeptide repeat protein [Verrucomicrobiales bacterium]MCP5558182.1 tetratricopeptide repeat protein [Verrucomicrobiaceae bacterium]
MSFSSILDERVAALIRDGRLADAAGAASAAIEEVRREMDAGDPKQRDLLINRLEQLAGVQRDLGDVPAAEAAFEEAIGLAVAGGSGPERLGGLRMNLAALLDFNQREADAVPLYEQAIADMEAVSPPNLEVGGQLRNNLAMIYKGLGKYALAEQHYLRSLEQLEALYGRDSEAVASVYNNLGSLYYTAGFPDQAREMFTDGLTIREKLLGDKHPDVAQSLSNLATACYELGEMAVAQGHYERSLGILEANMPSEARSYEAVGLDYLALLEQAHEDSKATIFRKRMDKVLA